MKINLFVLIGLFLSFSSIYAKSGDFGGGGGPKIVKDKSISINPTEIFGGDGGGGGGPKIINGDFGGGLTINSSEDGRVLEISKSKNSSIDNANLINLADEISNLGDFSKLIINAEQEMIEIGLENNIDPDLNIESVILVK